MRPGLVAVVLLATAATACGGDDARLTVLAASSLAEPLAELERRFEARHPGTDVVVSLGSSTTLAQQVADGAPGDVLATADELSMSLAVDAGAAGEPEIFATNRLVLVTPRADPARITGMGDLDRADVSYATCVPTAPCGRVAGALLADSGTSRPPVSEEVDVKSVLARVVSGEVDAGLVYRSDAVAAGDAVRAVRTDGAEDHPTGYLLAALTDEDRDGEDRDDEDRGADLAAELIDLVLSAEGQQVLAEAGFDPVDAP